jgi:UDP-2,3-diacylglucosamine hydrolase
MPPGWPPQGLHTLHAPAHWQVVDFVSDLHLAEAPSPTFDAWAAYMRRTPADAVLILGDLFEAWVGDDARAEPFEADCLAVLADAARRCEVGFMCGNRDFLVGDATLRACGALALPDPTLLLALGQRLLLSHGDLLCLADVEHQRFRAQVRAPAWRQAVLALPLAQRRVLARQMRDASQQRQHEPSLAWADVDPAAALAWLAEAGSRHLIHGHTHRPGDVELAAGRWRHVLTDWDLAADPPRAEVLRLDAAGLQRIALADSLAVA